MMCNRLRNGGFRRKDIKKCKAGNEERGICSRRRPLINAMNRITILKYILEYYNLCQLEVATINQNAL